ncbi:MAG: hypothetical protein ACO1QB_10055 [Verrucomicrobiales bacterium]
MRKTTQLLVGTALFAGAISTLSAQTIVNETFNYADTTALQANWNNPNGLTLDSGNGVPSPSASHSGVNAAHSWTGSTLSILPSDATPILLSADLYYTGASAQRNTVGLRTGADPLFEIGFYNDVALGASGLATRILGFAGKNNWVGLASYDDLGATPEWIHVEALFTGSAVTITYDRGNNGTINGTFTSTGDAYSKPFSDLRFGGPSALTSPGGGFNVDNISIVAVPEPSIIAIGALGGLALLARGWSRGRRE